MDLLFKSEAEMMESHNKCLTAGENIALLAGLLYGCLCFSHEILSIQYVQYMEKKKLVADL